MKIFSYDSPLMTVLSRLLDYVVLGLMWILVSIPIVTLGAATTAMLFTAEISIHRGEGKLLFTFWKSFRREFKQASLLWLIAVLTVSVIGLNLFASYSLALPTILLVLNGVVFLFVCCWTQLWFGYLCRFNDRTRTILGNTLFIALKNLHWAIPLVLLTTAALVGIISAALSMSMVLLLIPGAYVMLAGMVFRLIFRKYDKQAENVEGGTAL